MCSNGKRCELCTSDVDEIECNATTHRVVIDCQGNNTLPAAYFYRRRYDVYSSETGVSENLYNTLTPVPVMAAVFNALNATQNRQCVPCGAG